MFISGALFERTLSYGLLDEIHGARGFDEISWWIVCLLPHDSQYSSSIIWSLSSSVGNIILFWQVFWETAHGYWQDRLSGPAGSDCSGSPRRRFTLVELEEGRHPRLAGDGCWTFRLHPSIQSDRLACQTSASALGNGEPTVCRLGPAIWQIQIWRDLRN